MSQTAQLLTFPTPPARVLQAHSEEAARRRIVRYARETLRNASASLIDQVEACDALETFGSGADAMLAAEIRPQLAAQLAALVNAEARARQAHGSDGPGAPGLILWIAIAAIAAAVAGMWITDTIAGAALDASQATASASAGAW